MAKGKLLTFVAIAVLLVSAWWIQEVAPSLRAPRWVGMPLAMILALHLELGYRGFKWIVGAALVLLGVAAAWQLIPTGSPSGANPLLLVPLGVAAILLGPALCLAPAVDSFLRLRRSQRSEHVPSLLLALWIVVLAVVAVWIWVRVGVQVF